MDPPCEYSVLGSEPSVLMDKIRTETVGFLLFEAVRQAFWGTVVPCLVG